VGEGAARLPDGEPELQAAGGASAPVIMGRGRGRSCAFPGLPEERRRREPRRHCSFSATASRHRLPLRGAVHADAGRWTLNSAGPRFSPPPPEREDLPWPGRDGGARRRSSMRGLERGAYFFSAASYRMAKSVSWRCWISIAKIELHARCAADTGHDEEQKR